MKRVCHLRLSVFARCVTFFALCVVAACANTGSSTTSIPGDGEDDKIMGGPPWSLPASRDVASLPPDIATPLQGMAGTWTGGRLGSKLSSQTRDKMIELTQLTLSQTAPGQKVAWTSGKIAGTVTPQVRFTGPQNLICREFHQVIRLEGVVETGYATACQAADGSWRLLAE